VVEGADEEGHVVVLWGAGSEFVGSFEDAGEELIGGGFAVRAVEELPGCDQHSVLAPLFVLVVHGFGDSVGECDEHVAGVKLESLLSIGGVGEQADHGSCRLEWDGFSAAEDVGRIVASVDVGEEMGEGIVFGVEECGVAAGGGGLVDNFVDAGDESAEITLAKAGDAAKARAEARHDKGRGDAFA